MHDSLDESCFMERMRSIGGCTRGKWIRSDEVDFGGTRTLFCYRQDHRKIYC